MEPAGNHNGRMLQGILPAWVEPDPLKSRAVDALGLQAIADRPADRLLPGLSVLTTRARYFTFLCWARQKAGKRLNEHEIHRFEVALALTESRLSEDDAQHQEDCRFVGKRNIETYRSQHQDRIPRDARSVYKVPAWRAYRASMIALGLLAETASYDLTVRGVEAATLFQKAVRHRGRTPKPLRDAACLSRVSRPEQRLLRDLLGLSLPGTLDDDSLDPRTRRARFGREMRPFYRDGMMAPETVLVARRYRKSGSLAEPANTLRAAGVWEYLSLGLNVLFVAWARAVEAGDVRAFRKAVAERLATRRVPSQLAAMLLEGADLSRLIAGAVACLHEAVSLFDGLPEESSRLLEEDRFDLARRIIDRSKPAKRRVQRALEELLTLHCCAKGDEAWIECHDLDRLDQAKVNRDTKGSWQLPKRVTLHGYRMAAFDQIVFDLGGL